MEKSGEEKASQHDDGINMISKLKDRILRLILECPPTTEDQFWCENICHFTLCRSLWTSVLSIDIDYSRGLDPFEEFQKNKFEEFVYGVLANKSIDLDSFRLSCENYYNMLTIGWWILLAFERKVKRLDLMFCPREENEDIVLPHCPKTCGLLESLKLFLFGRRLRLPDYTVFPALRVLELNNVELSDDGSVTNFLLRCPLLEELKLKNLVFSGTQNLDELGENFHSSILISCPKLVFLELTGYIRYSNFILESLDSLKKAVIDLKGTPSELMGNTMHELFAGISHVESLSLNPFFSLMCIDAASLPNLKTLELTTTIDDFPMDDLIQILECYPHLDALHLIIQDVFSDKRRNSWRFPHRKMDEAETRRILTRHLKRVEFLEFNGENPSLLMAGSLLLYGNELEEMVFSCANEDKYRRKSMETMKKMSNFHKASSTIKLITLLKQQD